MTKETSVNLYKLTGELLALERAIEEDETKLEEMMQIEVLRDKKFESILYVRKNFAALADARSAEAKKLAQLAKVAQNKVDALDAYVLKNMKPGETFDCAIGGYSTRKSERCEAVASNTDESAPEEFIKLVPKIMVQAIKDAINAGKRVKGWAVYEYQTLTVK
jgi:hypothetical protein